MAGTSLSVVSSATANRGGVPAWTSTPTVRGKNEVDRKLSVRVSYDQYTYTPTLKYARPLQAFQWKRDGAAITGATDPVYVTQVADEGTRITCTITLTGENGSASATTGTTFTSYDRASPGDDVNSAESTYSNLIAASTITTTVDLVGLGLWKTSKTTGSMTAGSPTLTVASSSGFTIGDTIIVETGGEAGAGAVGTKGVGGTYPTLSYATTGAMNADTSQTTGKRAWVEASGLIYAWDGAAWDVAYSANDFYFYRAMPKALVAEITNIVGNTITLDTNSVVATTNANVYYDCTGLAEAYTSTNEGATVAARKVTASAGEFAFSGTFFASIYMKDFVFEGAGKTQTILVAPAGCQSINSSIIAQRAIYRNFGIRGNHRLNSWAMDGFDDNAYSRSFATSFYGSLCSDCLFDDIAVESTRSNCVVFGGESYDCWTRNCTATQTIPMRAYAQWCFNVSDSFTSGIVACTVTSSYAIPAFETFGSYSTHILRCTTTNGYFSVNSGIDWYVDDLDITVTAGSAYNYQVGVDGTQQNWVPSGTVINLNTNISNQQGSTANGQFGGVLNNFSVIESGFMEAGTSGRNRPITLAPGYAGAMIRNGYVEVPARTSGDAIEGFACDGDSGTLVDVRFVGLDQSGDTGILFRYADTLGHGRVVDCIADSIEARVSRRNQTNAQYTG